MDHNPDTFSAIEPPERGPCIGSAFRPAREENKSFLPAEISSVFSKKERKLEGRGLTTLSTFLSLFCLRFVRPLSTASSFLFLSKSQGLIERLIDIAPECRTPPYPEVSFFNALPPAGTSAEKSVSASASSSARFLISKRQMRQTTSPFTLLSTMIFNTP